MVFPVKLPISIHRIHPIGKSQVSAWCHRPPRLHTVYQMYKAAEVILMQMSQDQQINNSDIPLYEEFQ